MAVLPQEEEIVELMHSRAIQAIAHQVPLDFDFEQPNMAQHAFHAYKYLAVLLHEFVPPFVHVEAPLMAIMRVYFESRSAC